jgi:phage terminase small subunit
MKTDKEQLTLQQQRFCDEYLVSFNAVKAAIKAGYSENTARKCELLHLPKVQAYLQAGMQRTSERLEITHDMILRELAKVAFANMGDYYDENAVLKPINQLTHDQKAAISHYQLIDCIGDYQERAGEISKIKLHNKLSALDKIARHVGFYVKKSESQRSESRKDVGMRMGDYVSPESEVLSRESEVLAYDAEVLERGDEKNLTLSPLDGEAGGEGLADVVVEERLLPLSARVGSTAEAMCASVQLHIRTLNGLPFAQQFIVDDVEDHKKDGRDQELVQGVGHVAYGG